MKAVPNIPTIGVLALLCTVAWISYTKSWPIIFQFITSCLAPLLTVFGNLHIPPNLNNMLHTILAFITTCLAPLLTVWLLQWFQWLLRLRILLARPCWKTPCE